MVFCRINELLPPAPPSICPVGAKVRLTPINPPRLSPAPPPLVMVEPVTAVKVLLLATPIDTPPLMAPVLMKVLPVDEVSNATRPVNVPLLTMLICDPLHGHDRRVGGEQRQVQQRGGAEG